jgi:hypothetical protein
VHLEFHAAGKQEERKEQTTANSKIGKMENDETKIHKTLT